MLRKWKHLSLLMCTHLIGVIDNTFETPKVGTLSYVKKSLNLFFLPRFAKLLQRQLQSSFHPI